MFKFVVTSAVLALTATSAHAADTYNFKILGFSKDNRTVAIADTVVQDGSGEGVADVSVIDIANNRVLVHVNARDESEDKSTEKKALETALSKVDLAGYGIEIGKSLGTTVLNRLPTDLGTDVIFAAQGYGDWGSTDYGRYSLTVTKKPAGATAACKEKEDRPALMTLTLKSVKAVKPVSMVLQSDSRLPSSRGCASDYRVSRVIRSGKALVVVVDYLTPGFEGGDKQHMVVTTTKPDFAD